MAVQWFYAPKAHWEQLEATLADPRMKWVYAERMEDTVLTDLPSFLDNSVGLSQWQHGRCFNDRLEVAWWGNSDRISMRVYAQNGKPPRIVGLVEGMRLFVQGRRNLGPYVDNSGWQLHPDAGNLHLDKQEKMLLVGNLADPMPGEHEGPVWWTMQIPRYLPYPLGGAKPQNVMLIYEVYKVGGIRCEQRFSRLEGV